MKAIFIIIRKELLDTVRDRRTLMVMVIIPLLLFPMILIVVSQIQAASSKDEAVKELTIGFSGGVEDLGLRDMLKEMPGFTLTEVTEADSLSPLIQRGQLDLGVSILPDFEHLADGRGTGKVLALYEDTEEGARERLKIVMDMFETQMVARRLDSLGLTADNIHPVEIIRENVAPKEQLIGKYIGGFLPYIFIIFCFMGCMFPAIDLFTGEKERGSMETILSVPVDRWKILVGKMTVVVIAGMSTAFLALIGLFVGMQITDTLPQEFMDLILDILSPQFLVLFLLMLLPMAAFFAGAMIPITIYAKTFKEAQSILSPLNFLVIMPAVVGMLPGVELNFGTALVPVLNVVLATKDLISGTLDFRLYAVVLLSLLTYASIAVFFSLRRFGDERNVLRT